MSTVHRVVNPSRDLLNTSRYSIPFFLHPKAEMDLSCLENCIDDNNPKSFDDISAGQFLEERLKDIGLKKIIILALVEDLFLTLRILIVIYHQMV